jgi:hypothetical protein
MHHLAASGSFRVLSFHASPDIIDPWNMEQHRGVQEHHRPMLRISYRVIDLQKSRGLLFSAKVQNHPGSNEIAKTCTKYKKYLRRLPQQNESRYTYPKWSTIYVGCFPQLSISRFGSCFTKNPDFGTPKMEKALFVVRNENRPPWRSSLSQGPRACPIWPCSDKLCHVHGRI